MCVFIILSFISIGCSQRSELHNYSYSINKKAEVREIFRNLENDRTTKTYLDLKTINSTKTTDLDKEIEIRNVLSSIESEKTLFLEPKILDENFFEFIAKNECVDLIAQLNRTIINIKNTSDLQYYDLIYTNDLIVVQYDITFQKTEPERELPFELEKKN
jgi:hypothetical protein